MAYLCSYPSGYGQLWASLAVAIFVLHSIPEAIFMLLYIKHHLLVGMLVSTSPDYLLGFTLVLLGLLAVG
jgi:hypothetical protein